jgi:hypothetical protein
MKQHFAELKDHVQLRDEGTDFETGRAAHQGSAALVLRVTSEVCY